MSDEAIASTIDGKNVILDANNIDIRGSSVVSDELTQIQAKKKSRSVLQKTSMRMKQNIALKNLDLLQVSQMV
jgi:hypothetical protein